MIIQTAPAGKPRLTSSMTRIRAMHPLTAFACSVGLTLYAACAGAQELYPSKPIHLIVTTAAGGAGDLVARSVAERLSEAMRQPVIIENQPAGNGGIAAGQVARAAPDGYSLLSLVDSTLTINPHLYRNLPYDPFRDFTPVRAGFENLHRAISGASA
jgi:tripartite-type tricarboxylate transporter receptor subunit TctC